MTSPSSRRARGVRSARDKALRARGLTTIEEIAKGLLVFELFRLFLPELVVVLSRFLHLALVLGLFLLFARLQEKVKRGQATAMKYKKVSEALM